MKICVDISKILEYPWCLCYWKSKYDLNFVTARTSVTLKLVKRISKLTWKMVKWCQVCMEWTWNNTYIDIIIYHDQWNGCNFWVTSVHRLILIFFSSGIGLGTAGYTDQDLITRVLDAALSSGYRMIGKSGLLFVDTLQSGEIVLSLYQFMTGFKFTHLFEIIWNYYLYLLLVDGTILSHWSRTTYKMF